MAGITSFSIRSRMAFSSFNVFAWSMEILNGRKLGMLLKSGEAAR